MHSYTLDEARRIVMNCSKVYDKNLKNKKYIIIYRDRHDNLIKELEVLFTKNNYQHLTGIELIDKYGNVREHVSELFYDKCVNNRLSKNEIKFKKDGTTNLKLAALPVMMSIHNVTKIAGDYNTGRPYLIADKLIGNINFCLGLKQIEETYVPVSALLENIKNLTEMQSQVLAIFSKGMLEDTYKQIRYVAKGINLRNIRLSEEILKKISLSEYIPKE